MKNLWICLLLSLFSIEGKAQKFAYGTGSDLWGVPTESDLEEAGELGFNYIELAPSTYGSGNYEQIIAGSEATKAKLVKTGMKVWSIHLPYGYSYDISALDSNTRKSTVERLRNYIKACAKVFSPKAMVLHPSAEPISDSERAQRITNSIESIKELKVSADEANVTLCVENLPRTCLGNTPEELLQIVTPIPGVKICFDTNHFLKGTIEHFIRTAGHLIGTVHIADYDFNDEKHWLPTHGKIAWGELIHELEEAGYEGVFMSESEKTNDGRQATIKQMKETYETIFAEYEELKDPGKRLKGYLEGIKLQYFADVPMDSVFCVGTAPGYYNKIAFDTFKTTYDAAGKAIETVSGAEESKAIREEVNKGLNKLLGAVNPIVDGYYWIQSGHTGFTSKNKTMACYTDDSNQLKWETFEPTLNFLFKVTRITDNLFSIQNMYGDTYIHTIAAGSGAIPMSSKQLVGQTIQAFNQFGMFSFYNTDNSTHYHIEGHREGAGTGGNIIPWKGDPGSGSSWFFQPVDTTMVKKLLEGKQKPSNRLSSFLSGVKSQYFPEAPMTSAFPIGKDPGFYPEKTFEKFAAAYDSASKATSANLSVEEVIEHEDGVKSSLEQLIKSANPLTEGYYWIQSAHNGFTSKEKTMACYSDESNQLKWKAFEPTLNFLFRIRVSGKNFSIRNMMTDAYIHTVPGYSVIIPMSSSPLSEQIIKPFNQSGMFSICNANNSAMYHIQGHSEGAGTGGEVVPWNGVAGSGSSWTIRAVDENELKLLLEYKNQLTIIAPPTLNDRSLVSVYTTDGVLVKQKVRWEEAKNGLTKGLYIVNRQKVRIR